MSGIPGGQLMMSFISIIYMEQTELICNLEDQNLPTYQDMIYNGKDWVNENDLRAGNMEDYFECKLYSW